ncbi:putative exportin 1, partial [Toxoplasma gondii GAB2-2007-GAL-DOM2]
VPGMIEQYDTTVTVRGGDDD